MKYVQSMAIEKEGWLKVFLNTMLENLLKIYNTILKMNFINYLMMILY